MITNDILYIGVNDRDIDLFEGQYAIPEGISYNSYLIMDEKTAVMDTVDRRKQTEYLSNLEKALNGRTPDYLVVSHVEPDHASSVRAFLDKYPSTQLVGNAKTFQMLTQYFELNLDNAVTVKEGDVLSLGRHQLHFIMAPMVHWPEVMFTYDSCEKILFSADAFGTFGALDSHEDWELEAAKYYFNIVGKFGMPVQTVLKKAASLDIEVICPLHGPVLKENLGHYLEKYQIWSSYEPELEGVFIAYASLHGNTAAAAGKLAKILKEKGCPRVEIIDLARGDMAKALENAFRFGKVVLAASSYNGKYSYKVDEIKNGFHTVTIKNPDGTPAGKTYFAIEVDENATEPSVAMLPDGTQVITVPTGTKEIFLDFEVHGNGGLPDGVPGVDPDNPDDDDWTEIRIGKEPTPPDNPDKPIKNPIFPNTDAFIRENPLLVGILLSFSFFLFLFVIVRRRRKDEEEETA